MKKFLFLFLIGLLLFSCTHKKVYKKDTHTSDIKKPWSWGKLQTIYVFADDDLWEENYHYLKMILERKFFTTEDEKYFEIKRAPYKDLEEFYKYNNLLFLGIMNSSDDVSAYVKSVMKKKVTDEVTKKKRGIYAVNNLWAQDQIIAFVLAYDKKNLVSEVKEKNAKIFKIFLDKLYARIKEKTYKRELYPPSSFKDLPWKMDITKNYVLYKRGERFTSFLSRIVTKPDKYVAVYYEKIDKKDFGKEWMIKARSKIGETYYEGDKIDKLSFIVRRKYKIGKYKCIKIHGRWQNEKYYIGGAFQSFGIYDDKTHTAFLIDNSVYYPQGKKLLSMIELEVISSTFEIKTPTDEKSSN